MPKPVTYTPRERVAIMVADRIVLRLYSKESGWAETEAWPTQHETIADCLRRVQDHLQCASLLHPALQRACLYVGGEHPEHGMMLASVPRDSIPVEVEFPLATTPVPASARRYS